MREKSVTEQVLDPNRSNLGNLGAAMVKAAKRLEPPTPEQDIATSPLATVKP